MKNKKEVSKTPTQKAKELNKLYSPESDPQGSYTGKPEAPFEKPVQDADDL